MKIAGTYTPFAVLMVGGIWGVDLFGAVWIVALSAAVAKLFMPGAGSTAFRPDFIWRSAGQARR